MESKYKNVLKNLSEKDIQEKICELVYKAGMFLNWSKKLLELYIIEYEKYKNSIKKLIKLYNKPIVKFIIIHNVLYFQEAVLDLNTLFERKGNPTEISFKFYFFNTKKSELEKNIDKVVKEYDKTGLREVRNKVLAHKQIDKAGDPISLFINPINKEHIEKAFLIIQKLKELIKENFKCYNYFENYYNSSFEFLYNYCEKKFK